MSCAETNDAIFESDIKQDVTHTAANAWLVTSANIKKTTIVRINFM